MENSKQYFFLSLFILTMSLIQPVIAQSKLDTLPGKVIHFGHGGGFTGIVYSYVLKENGDVYKGNAFDPSGLTFLTKVLSFQANAAFLNIEHLGIDSISNLIPGNMYSFVDIEVDGSRKRISWTRGSTIPGNLKLFYEQLLALIPKN